MKWSSRVLVILFTAMLTGGLWAQSGATSAGQSDKQFQAALQLEMVTGDHRRAIEEYRKVVTRPGVSRALAAEALLRIAECQQKAGDADAQKTYQEIVAKYSDQTSIAATARGRLPPAAASTTGRFASQDILQALDWVGPTLAESPLARVSPDGRWIMFTRVNAAVPEMAVWLRDLNSGAERVLVEKIPGDRPLPFVQWANDSRRLVISHLVTEATVIRRELIVMDLTNTSAETIRFSSISMSRQSAPARVPNPLLWSSDGRQLVYLASSDGGGHEVRVFESATGRTRAIAPIQPIYESTRSITLPQLRWSPDRSEVAVQNGAVGGVDEVRIVRVADGSARTVRLPVEPGQRAVLTAFTPRGLVLRREPQAARASNVAVPLQMVLLDPSTGRASVVCAGSLSDNNAANPASETLVSNNNDVCLGVTSDGQRAMRWSAELQRVVLRDTVTGQDTNLTSGVGEERYPTLINNDQTALFFSNADGRWGLYAAPVARAPVAKPALIEAFDDLPSSAAIKPTVDGFAMSAGYGGWNLWRIDTDPATGRGTGAPVQLTPNVGDSILASVSPDGRRVAYWSRRGRTGLAVMDANGANKRIVRDTDQPRFHNYGVSPVWISNEEILYADYSARTSTRRFFVINLRSGENNSIPFPELEAAPADGTRRSWQVLTASREMVYVDRATAAAAATFRARPLDGGTDRILATLDVPVSAMGDFLIAPDGGRIAYRSRGRWQLYDVAAESVVTSAMSLPTPGDWSRDGQYLLTALDGQPAVFDFGTGKPLPILSVPLPGRWMLEEAGDAGWWAPDRSFVIVTLGGGRRESRQWHGVTAEAVAKASGAVK